MFGAFLYVAQTPRKVEQQYLESFKMWCWRRIEKIKQSETVTIEQVVEHTGEKKDTTK